MKRRDDPEVIERFWSKVEIKDDSDCWLWQGRKNRTGYGHFSATSNVHYRAHRYAWEITNGSIPDEMYVIHNCDNPPCVNPKHLRLGTAQDNTDDMWSRNRGNPPVGERNRWCKLTRADVEYIRTAPRYRGFVRDVCKRFGVHKNHILNITKGKARKRG